MFCSFLGCCAPTDPPGLLAHSSPLPTRSVLTAARALLWGSILFKLGAHDLFQLNVDSLYQQALRMQKSNTSRGMKKEVGHGSPPPGRALQPGQQGVALGLTVATLGPAPSEEQGPRQAGPSQHGVGATAWKEHGCPTPGHLVPAHCTPQQLRC